MTQINKSAIQWYEPEDNRRRPRATMKANGILCFGLGMQDELMGKIKLGFLRTENAIIIKQDADKGRPLPSNGQLRLENMAKQMLFVGLRLPLCFLFEKEANGLGWKGYIVPPFRKERAVKPKKAVSSTEYMWLLKPYEWLINRAVALFAKSTPLEERRATAGEALIEALHEYTPIYGNLKEYLLEKIKSRLIEHNKMYTGISRYNSTSLDAPVSPDDKDGRTRHELLDIGATNDLDYIDERLDFDIFSRTHLNSQEKRIFDMLLNGYTVDEIQHTLQINESELTLLCMKIGENWKGFSQFDTAV